MIAFSAALFQFQKNASSLDKTLNLSFKKYHVTQATLPLTFPPLPFSSCSGHCTHLLGNMSSRYSLREAKLDIITWPTDKKCLYRFNRKGHRFHDTWGDCSFPKSNDIPIPLFETWFKKTSETQMLFPHPGPNALPSSCSISFLFSHPYPFIIHPPDLVLQYYSASLPFHPFGQFCQETVAIFSRP